MNSYDLKIRFDELCAGHALGDLSIEEEHELASLCGQLGLTPDESLDLLAAALDVELFQNSSTILPDHLSRRLHEWADQAAEPPATTIIHPRVSTWKMIASNPVSGWIAAAAMLLFSLIITREKSELSPTQAETRFRAEAADLIERKFAGAGNFEQVAGTVIWSDQLQQGYMALEGVPVNDPSQAQYQLWIVDPARDPDSPVDGGVFDIPTDGSPVIIPIAAKLALNKPQAFVITLEQPGGVVKSKQKKVVALAKG
jgi:hypothetical protein